MTWAITENPKWQHMTPMLHSLHCKCYIITYYIKQRIQLKFCLIVHKQHCTQSANLSSLLAHSGSCCTSHQNSVGLAGIHSGWCQAYSSLSSFVSSVMPFRTKLKTLVAACLPSVAWLVVSLIYQILIAIRMEYDWLWSQLVYSWSNLKLMPCAL